MCYALSSKTVNGSVREFSSLLDQRTLVFRQCLNLRGRIDTVGSSWLSF